MEKQKEQSIKADRLVSIDALRGFLEWLLLYYLYKNRYFIKL